VRYNSDLLFFERSQLVVKNVNIVSGRWWFVGPIFPECDEEVITLL